jgi:predicted esterase YcpF (UPF0227 family)
VPKILYIHGFASCAKSSKAQALKAFFGEANIIAPDLPPAPIDAVEMIQEMIDDEDITMIVGSSLGGFYAAYLAELNAIKTVLINPSLRPFETLAPFIGWQQRLCGEDEAFEFKSIYLEHLKNYSVDIPQRGSYLVLLQSGDELLDYHLAQSCYKEHRVIVEQGGSHRFDRFDDYLCMIRNYFQERTERHKGLKCK